jgi:hypothetical protein
VQCGMDLSALGQGKKAADFLYMVMNHRDA